MSYFGTFLLIWLAVGFIIGVKEVYVKESFKSEAFKQFVEDYYEENGRNDYTEKVIDFLTDKKKFIALTTLLGFIPLIAKVVSIVKKIKSMMKNENK